MPCNTHIRKFVAQNFKHLLLLMTLIIGLPSCRCSENLSSVSQQNQPTKSQIVNLAIWSNFIANKTLQRFESQTGIKVQVTYYSTNEEVLAKIQAGATGYDVIVPSDYMVATMSKLGLLEELEKTKIPHINNVDPTHMNRSFDRNNRYSLPYAWSYGGIAVNRAQYSDPVVTWADLFFNEKLKGRIGYTDDARETLGNALKMLGFSLNSQNAEEIEAAKQALVKSKIAYQAVISDDYDSLIRGDIAIAQFYSSDALQASKRAGGKIEFIIPKEGGSLSTEHLVILKTAPHREEAYQLINFLLTAESNKELVGQTFAGPIISGVSDQMATELPEGRAIFPSTEQLRSYEVLEDVGDFTAIYEQKWTEFKSSQESSSF